MLSELCTLIGFAFFIKIFFDGAKKIIVGSNGDIVKNKTYAIHAGLGFAFIIVSRLLLLFL
ncbi:hypothetical protein [Enterococcus sp. AZ109]|uniref:hypothetical protein n=1 Tax=Enterococcus sp. AZ109 TaxID=2774634 RepID=UPI003F251AA9